ncbi:hypothetical protein KFL_003680060 [Klebsormidium nitens]|uniref:Coenzyme Q-binding protein COQ10 START domain-containing protein n=1 Tax=Klebsormidium nitens TaxID=105231 RepID=A0A1Y1IFV9_KLENI|nr:hypothetical protein KFL_003680060 [Klebsormidium nitens]|eukprot:GAQ87656.1 hypothetical protein KFL_003680060 [Klebsormidium nitens]
MEEYADAPHMATEQFEIVDSELVDELPAPQIDFSDDPRGAVNMRARFEVPMDFDHLWTVVTDPDEFTRVFSRTFKGYDDLEVHEDDGAGRRSLEMVREQWFDMKVWRGSVSTHLYLEEDRSEGLIDFRMGRPGFMKVFEGSWQIHQVETPTGVPLSQVALYQTLKPSIPGIVPNKAFFIRQFTKKVTEDMVSDLRAEAARTREAGHKVC